MRITQVESIFGIRSDDRIKQRDALVENCLIIIGSIYATSYPVKENTQYRIGSLNLLFVSTTWIVED